MSSLVLLESDHCRTSLAVQTVAVLLSLLAVSSASARQGTQVVSSGETRITLAAAVHLRGSVGLSPVADGTDTRIGFGVRRARFRINARLGPRAGMFMQMDGAAGSVTAVDLWGYYSLSPKVRVRVGRMASAQPRGLVTSMTRIDAVSRAAIAERWGRTTIGGGGRDFGVDVRYRSESIEAVLFLHNGDGNWDRSRGNYRADISRGSATGGIDRNALAVTGSLWWQSTSLPGLEIGGFGGYNGSRNPYTEKDDKGRRYITYGLHAYYGAEPGSQLFRLKVDAVGITYESIEASTEEQESLGISVLAAVRPIAWSEIFIRGEAHEIDINGPNDADGFFTAGVSFSPSKRRGGEYHPERFTVAWARFADGILGSEPEDLLLLQLQLIF